MSTPQEFLEAAKCIVKIANSEALCRAAINRLYYATYHKCYAYHVSLPDVGSVVGATGKHNQLISQLSNPGKNLSAGERARSVAVGKTLRLLCAQRVIADYYPDELVDAQTLSLADKNADTIFANI